MMSVCSVDLINDLSKNQFKSQISKFQSYFYDQKLVDHLEYEIKRNNFDFEDQLIT